MKLLNRFPKSILWVTLFAFSALVTLIYFPPLAIQKTGATEWADWTGFGQSTSTSIEKDANGIIRKTVDKPEPGKTFWDCLNALIVPGLLALIGYSFQHQQKAQADANLREEALQSYLDSLANILLDKKIDITRTEDPWQKTGLDLVQARTLSLQRMLEEDKIRLASLVLFLSNSGLLNLGMAYWNDKEIDLSDAYLENINLSEINLNKANLSGANLSRASLNKATLREADLRGANFRKADLRGANLKKAQLQEAHLSAKLLRVATTSCRKVKILQKPLSWLQGNHNASATQLVEAHLGETNLTGANLSGVILRYANLSGADLQKANVTNANFSCSLYSEKTKFPEGFTPELNRETMYKIGPGEDLKNVKFQGLLLMGEDLKGANLQAAKLERADLRDADLRGANFQGTDLRNANLQGANLQGAKNLTLQQVQAARNWKLACYDREFCKQLGLPPEINHRDVEPAEVEQL